VTTNFVVRIPTVLIILTNGKRILLGLLATIKPSLQLVTEGLFTGQKTAYILVRIDVRFVLLVASMDVRLILRTPMTPAAPLTKVKVILAHGNGIVLVNVTHLTPRKSVRIVVTGSPKTSRQKGIHLPVLTIEVTGTRGRDLVVGRISLPENRQIVMMRVIVMGRRHVEGAEGTDPGTVAVEVIRLPTGIIGPSHLLGLPNGVVILDDDIVTVSKLVISMVVRLSIVSW